MRNLLHQPEPTRGMMNKMVTSNSHCFPTTKKLSTFSATHNNLLRLLLRITRLVFSQLSLVRINKRTLRLFILRSFICLTSEDIVDQLKAGKHFRAEEEQHVEVLFVLLSEVEAGVHQREQVHVASGAFSGTVHALGLPK